MRNGSSMALVALALLLALPASAEQVGDVNVSLWQTVPVFDGFGFRETLAASADIDMASWMRVRTLARLSSAADIRGSALRQPTVPVLGSFYEFAPSSSVLIGTDTGPWRIQGGLGLAYNIRLALTEESVVGFPIIPTGTTSFGTIKQIGLTWDPGLDAVVEVGFAVPLGFRVVVGFGGSVASARLLVRPREDPALEISVPELFLTWTFQVGVSWSTKPVPPPPPAPLP